MSEAAITQTEASPRAALITLLEKQSKTIMKGLPTHLKPERMMRVCQTAISKTPALWECDPMTVIGSIVQASEIGLEPNGVLGEAALVPFWNKKTQRKECQLMVMYRGYVELADRAGKSDYVDAQVVYEGDVFEFEYGSDAKLRHVPTLDPAKRGKAVGVYALVRYKSGIVKFIVLSFDDVEKVRQCSNAKDADAWSTWWDEMAKKTALKRLFKYERLSPEISRATYLDDSIEGGVNPDEVGQTFAEQVDGDQQVEDLKRRLGEAAAASTEAGDASTEPETIDTTAEVITDEDGVVVEDDGCPQDPPPPTEPDPAPEPTDVKAEITFEPHDPTVFGADSKFCERVSELLASFIELATGAGKSEDEARAMWIPGVMKLIGEEGCTTMGELDQKQKNSIVKALAAKVKAYSAALDEKES